MTMRHRLDPELAAPLMPGTRQQKAESIYTIFLLRGG